VLGHLSVTWRLWDKGESIYLASNEVFSYGIQIRLVCEDVKSEMLLRAQDYDESSNDDLVILIGMDGKS
jgi:hypothetical protein